MALYRQEDLDDQFVAEARKVHDDQLAAMERRIKDSAIGTVCPSPDQLNKPRDAKKLLASMMLLGILASETTGESYMEVSLKGDRNDPD